MVLDGGTATAGRVSSKTDEESTAEDARRASHCRGNVEAPPESGLYYFQAEGESGAFFSFPWVIAPRRPTCELAVLASTNTWSAYNNQYWPAFYFIDAKGHLRYTHFGEGNYDYNEKVVQQLLSEAKSASR